LPIRIKVKNAETGATVEMELEAENTVDEVIESAATFWSKDMADDVLELIPDPEGG
jgi:translation elongation factor P/translation initiation factor 5A